MKKIIFIVFIFSYVITNAQAPSWAWAKGVGGNIGIANQDNGTTWVNGVATDLSGNVYSIGYFQTPTLVVGNYTLTNTNNSGTNSDVFVIKYDAFGNVLWAKSTTGSSSNGLGIAIDVAYNIYITGGFSGSAITFDNKTLTNTSTGTDDIFIIKCNASGNVIWAKNFGGTNDEFGNAITIDANNNFYITGNFKSRPLSIDTYSITTDSIGKQNMFIAKFDSSCNPLYAKSVGKSCVISTVGSNVVTDINNNTFVTGCFSSSKIAIGNDTLINRGETDFFIVKYNSFGNELWARSAGGIDGENVNCITVDGNNNVVIAGYFMSQSFEIGTDTLLLNVPILNSLFIAKYNAQGNVVWAENTGIIIPSNFIPGPCVTIGSNNSVYVAGTFGNSIDNSPYLVIANDTLNNNDGGQGSVLVAKYDSSGNAVWGKTATAISQNEVHAITADKYGNIYAVGAYDDTTIVFDFYTLVNKNTNYETSDYFIAKIGTAGVGIEKHNAIDNVIVYPNPSNGNISIASTNNIDYIKVTDMLGQIVYEIKPFAEKTTLQINYAGVYFVTITTGKETSTKKIIVNK